MRVELRLGGLITIGGRAIALGRTHALLDAVAEGRSVSGAAERLRLSYRSAWEQLRALEDALGRPVVVKTKGHGTVLTPLGAGLRDALAGTVRSFERAVIDEGCALEARLAALLDAGPARLRLATSHDPLLLAALGSLPHVDVRVVGSEEAVGLLLAGEADLAGFHRGADEAALPGALAGAVGRGEIGIVPLLRREQGFVVAPGNPLGIGGVADIARLRARFVNRQRGSGTRRWFDGLLARAGLEPTGIEGYGTEEFTHAAVAALVAAGAADVGMGLRWAAERFGLGFVPVGWESFDLAGRPDALPGAVEAIREALAERVVGTDGYASP